MEAGITLGLTVGPADRRAHLLSASGMGQFKKKKKREYKQVGHVLSRFLLRCFLDGERLW